MDDPRNGCPDFDERLVQSLFAPSPDAGLDRHVAACARCRSARAAYLETGDAIVAAFGLAGAAAAPRTRSFVPWAAAAALVAAAGLVAALLVRRDAPLPSGPTTLATAHRLRFRPGERLAIPPGVAQIIDGIATIDLDAGAALLLSAAPDPRFELASGHVRLTAAVPVGLTAGDATIRAAAGADFDIELVSEGGTVMNREWLLPGTVGALGAAAATAAVFLLVNRGDVTVALPGQDRPERAAPGTVQIIERPVETMPAEKVLAMARLEAEVARLRSDLEAARGAEETAGADVRRLSEENRQLRESAAHHETARAGTVDRVLKAIDELKDQGLATFVRPGATAQLVADLKALGAEGVKALLPLLKADEDNTRLLAAKLLEDMADPASISALEETALKDDVELVANMSSHALALMDSTDTNPALHRIVAECKHEGAKVNALFGLAKNGDARGLELTAAYLRDQKNSAGMRTALGAGLLMVPNPKLFPIATEFLDGHRDEPRIMGLAVEFYRRLGSPEALGRLRAIAEDSTQSNEVRAAARKALGS